MYIGLIGALIATRCGAATSADGTSLQRIYGTAFPKMSQLREWEKSQAKAKLRDHRILGKAQKLFMFHPSSPGSAFLLPHGTRIFNTMLQFLRNEYTKRGYEEVISPLLFKSNLWQTSGHLENYKEDMFFVKEGENCEEKEKDDGMGLKPMNCPAHCLIYKESKAHSYRDLPVRYADFTALHR